MRTQKVIFWFRQDLRTEDNPGLLGAAQAGTVVPIYILPQQSLGAANRFWLHHSLKALNNSLDQKLSVFEGAPLEILLKLVKLFEISDVFWNRCYEPWQIHQDQKVEQQLVKEGIKVHTSNGFLLWEPWTILKGDQTPYKVFSPYYKKGCLNGPTPRLPLPKPSNLKLHAHTHSDSISKLNLLPKIRWDQKIKPYWEIGETGALKKLNQFLKNGLSFYKEGRDYPSREVVSRLSPYLHFGEISPNKIWHAVVKTTNDNNSEQFLSELAWREFSYYLLYHFPDLPNKNFQTKFDKFPWVWKSKHLESWQKGQTGYPLIDAGMRQLILEGYMHNRVRMIVASFLVKNLLIHWKLGQDWFAEYLVDADLASNSASWQWVAGSGVDAAPYFRIFNPITQGEKFDPEGEYTCHFIPELARLPKKYLFCPWEAPKDVLKKAQVELGKTYPLPILDLKESRARALEALEQCK